MKYLCCYHKIKWKPVSQGACALWSPHFCQLHPLGPFSPLIALRDWTNPCSPDKLPRAGCEFQLVPILSATSHTAPPGLASHEFITCNFICCAEQTHVNYERWWKWSRVYFASLFSASQIKTGSAGEELTIKCAPLYLQRALCAHFSALWFQTGAPHFQTALFTWLQAWDFT